jgi:tetratricopeptide (TPR) repeat protein
MAILEIDPAATPTFIGVARFLMEGITLAPGGTARRDLPPLTDTDLVRIKQREKALERAENLQALAKPDSSGLAGPEKLMARLPDMLKSLPEDQGAAAAYALADSFAHSGQWPLARETFLTLVDKYPKSREAIDAYRWLARFSSSSEARRRFELGQFMTRVNIEVVPTSGQQPKGSQIQQSFDPKLMGTVEHAILSQDPAETRKGYEFTLEMEKKLAQFGPLYVYDPALQFCFQSARRNLGDPECARNWYSKFLAETSYVNNDPNARPDPWRELAMAELWLINRNGKPVRPLGSCRQTTTRPYLDGKLDDACWQNAKALPLKTSAGELGAEFTSKAFFAYDNDFLYIGVECKHPKGMQVPKVEKRERDMDLRAFDRVSILLDLDRNYQTYYHLEVDQRGALAEDCWGDKSWNPRWFVAVDSNETGWTAEFAIPRGELTGERIHAGKVWACNVVRVVPGKGIQAWSTPADISPRPEGMGLLMFTDK